MFPLEESTGESLMRWTVRVAVVMVLIRAAYRLRNRPALSIPTRIECWLWGCGLLAYLAHVALAFHYVHGWSHHDAWQHTADETARVTSIRRGDGLWVNYLFTAIWLGDLGRLAWAHFRRRPTSRRFDLAIFFLFTFMIFNATVVFGSAFYRILAIPAAALLGWSWWAGRHNIRADSPMKLNE